MGARRTLGDAAEGLPGWLADHLVAERDGTPPAMPPIDPDVVDLTARDSRASTSSKVATLLRSATRSAGAGHESSALRRPRPSPAARGAGAVETSLPRGAGRLWQLLRRRDELWVRHASLTDRRPGGADKQLRAAEGRRAGRGAAGRRAADLRAVDGEGARGARPPVRAAHDGGDRGGDVHLRQHRAHPRPQHPAQAGSVPAQRGGATGARPQADPRQAAAAHRRTARGRPPSRLTRSG